MGIIETTYDQGDLKRGKCRSCGEMSNEILIGDSRCVDCIDADNFYEMTMNQKDEDEED